MIKNGSVVSFEYTVSDESGKVLESSKGQEPMTYTHGQQEIIPALERALKSGKTAVVNVFGDKRIGHPTLGGNLLGSTQL